MPFNLRKNMSNNSICYMCPECETKIFWTINNFKEKGEPICPACDTDMKYLKDD